MKDGANIVIIGGGIIGLAIASSLSRKFDDIFVLEKNRRVGLETSTHNSGVIHSGIHYPPGSLKAALCVKGNRMIYDICEKNGIPFKRLGKLTVATNESEINILRKLHSNGVSNGVEDMRFLDRNEIRDMENQVNAKMALYTPSSGIVEQDELIQYFHSEAVKNNVIVSTDTEVTGIRNRYNDYELKGMSAKQPFSIFSKTVINCAGLYSDRIAEMAGLDIDRLRYRLTYFKGDYYRVLGRAPVSMLVYPVPGGAGLGIHLTPDMAGSVKLGPNAYPVRDIDYTQGSRKDEFIDDVMRFLPSIKNERIQYDSSGIRPKLCSDTGEFRDFVIRHERDHGMRGFINLIGIESPGLTASPAIAEYVMNLYEAEIAS